MMMARAALGEVKLIYNISFWDSIATDCRILIQKNANKLVRKKLMSIQASAINNLAVVYSSQGKQEVALEYTEEALQLYFKLGNPLEVAKQIENNGELNLRLGKTTEALEYYYKSLKLYESQNDQIGIAASLNKIGKIYANQGDLIKADEKFQESLKISLALGDKLGLAQSYGHLGLLYISGDPSCNTDECKKDAAKRALEYLSKSLDLFEELGSRRDVATTLSNIGRIYNLFGDPYCPDSILVCKKNGQVIALDYVERALLIREELKDYRSIMPTIINIGYAHFNMGHLDEAESYGIRGMGMAKEMSSPLDMRGAALLLSGIYEAKKEGLEALKMYKLHIQMRDSLNNEEIKNATTRQEIKYEYEKKKEADDAAHFKELAIEEEKKEKQQIISIAIAIGLILVVVFLFFVFNRLKVTRKQKQVIEDQKEVVEAAHNQLAVKNREITDSIKYAQRIQSAILPTSKKVQENLKDSFILYKPKDIVAGDFYWVEFQDGKTLFAAGDCTGHGVPGAMVSIVCNNGLNRSVREYGLTNPGEILDKTRQIVLEEFQKSDEGVKDGMDIALCSLDGNQLKYAGAHNPLWIIRNGEIIETKGNKQPIGQFDRAVPFATHTFELQKGDCIYLFSDGYVDQFGGVRKKKFKAVALRQLLLSIQDKTMDQQKRIVDDTFEKWKGNLEQIDDVCVIGVRYE